MSIFSNTSRASSSRPARAQRLDVPERADRERALARPPGRPARPPGCSGRPASRRPARSPMASSVDSQRGSAGATNLTSGISSRRRRARRVLVVLHERLALGVPAVAHDLVVDLVPVGCQPRRGRPGRPRSRRHPDRALDRHPAHQPRVGELLAAAADLPDPSSAWSQCSRSQSMNRRRSVQRSSRSARRTCCAGRPSRSARRRCRAAAGPAAPLPIRTGRGAAVALQVRQHLAP